MRIIDLHNKLLELMLTGVSPDTEVKILVQEEQGFDSIGPIDQVMKYVSGSHGEEADVFVTVRREDLSRG